MKETPDDVKENNKLEQSGKPRKTNETMDEYRNAGCDENTTTQWWTKMYNNVMDEYGNNT